MASTGSKDPELLLKSGKIVELVTFDSLGSGARAASAFKDSYFRVVTEHDGQVARKELEEYFQSHQLEDPYTLATRMKGTIVMGVYADSDGTLINRRDGHDEARFFSPTLALSIKKAIGKTGLFTIASAAHIKRALVLLTKARGQVPLERLLFFAENGYAAIIPIETKDGFEFEIHTAVMPPFVTSSNNKMKEALDELCKVAVNHELFMFVNQDKRAKITLELMKNGSDNNKEIVRRLVVPYLVKELGLDGSNRGETGAGAWLQLPDLTYSLVATGNSVEVDHDYLTSKRTVNTISSDLVRILWFKEFGYEDDVDGTKVFIGFGDRPWDSDAGLTDPLRGNVGFKVRDEPYKLKSGEKLMDIIRREADSPFVTLPAFSEDGTVRYGNGEAVGRSLERVFLTGTILRIKDLEEMRSSLRLALSEMRYVREQFKPEMVQGGMYTIPPYLRAISNVDELMKKFMDSDVADAEIADKISRIASEVGIE